MFKNLWKVVTAVCVCGFFLSMTPGEAIAANHIEENVGVETSSSYLVKIDAPAAKLYTACDANSPVTGRVEQGKSYNVLTYRDGWVKVETGNTQGYLRVAGQATVVETTKEKVDQDAALRNKVVSYAMQFVGNPYVYGGINPKTGADCSGFTSYVMKHAAGVSLSHSSVAQAGEGKAVSMGAIKPGDLIFYSSAGRINHVAIYAGHGQIVHASSEKTGIKVSKWNHRTPVRVVDVLSK